MKLSTLINVVQARAPHGFKHEWTRKGELGGVEVAIVAYSHQPLPVSQYHEQPREFRVAVFKGEARISDSIVSP